MRRRHAFDRFDRAALDLGRHDETRIDEPAVEQHVAGAAVAVVATFLGTGEAQIVAERLEQALARLAEEFGFLAVDVASHVKFLGHGGVLMQGTHGLPSVGLRDHFVFARSMAMCNARLTRMPTKCRR